MLNWQTLLEALNAVLALGLAILAWHTLHRFSLPLQRSAIRLISGAMGLFVFREVLTPWESNGARWIALVGDVSETLIILLAFGVLWLLWQSERREVSAMQQEAERDALTGLYNRRYFMRQAQQTLRRWEAERGETWLLLLDVDDFKAYNDTFGHPAGDIALKRIANVLRASMRKDDLIARMGGEEFAILLQTAENSLQTVIDRLQANVAIMGQPDEELHRQITVSIGAARRSPRQKHLDELIRAADRALYRAKWSGKNQACIYDPVLDGEGVIVHLCSRAAWEAAQQTGEYRPPSLSEVGFIHCCRPNQIADVAARFFPGQQDLVVLWIHPARVHAPIRWESADSDQFPHIYGALNLDAVQKVTPYS